MSYSRIDRTICTLRIVKWAKVKSRFQKAFFPYLSLFESNG